MRCQDCILHSCSKHEVSSILPNIKDRLPVFFIGEGPGFLEDKYGKPFIGDVGKIFDRALKAAGINRELCAIGNTVRCRPPENRTPLSAEIKACAPYLDADIKEYNPELIVPLGNVALSRIAKKTGITKLQGNLLESPYGKVIPCIHPAAVLRNPDTFKDLVRSLVRVREFLEGTERKAELKILIADTVNKVEKVVNTALTKKCIVMDLETTGFSFVDDVVLCYALTWSSNIGIVIPLLQQHKEDFWSSTELLQVKALLAKLGASDVPKIGHNIKFDMQFCEHNGYPLENVKFDTMLAHYLLDENREHGLKPLALQYTNFGDYDSDIKKYVKEDDGDDYSVIPNDMLWEYAAKDVACTYILFKEFGPQIKKNFNSFYKRWMISYMHVLRAAEYKGVCVDPVEAEVVTQDYIERIGKKEIELQKIPAVTKCVNDFYKEELKKLKEKYDQSKYLVKRHGSFDRYMKSRKLEKPEFNFNSPKQMRHLLFNVLKLKPIKKTKTGQPSTDAEVIEYFAKDIPEIAPVVEQRTLKKWLSTYILPTVGNTDFRVHTTFLLHGTVTGRLASRRPNVQNIPRDAIDIKRIYVPDPDCIFVQFDYAQAEFRLWGNYARDEKMLRDLRSGLDIHKLVASECFGISYEDVVKDQRQKAKNSTFGIMYGRGAKSVAAEHGFSVEEALEMIKRFFKRYPKAKRWVDSQHAFVKKHGYVTNIFGRVRRLPEIFGNEKEKVAEALRQSINAPIQSAATDFTSYAAMRVDSIVRSYEGVYFTFPVHDSLKYNIPKKIALELVPIIKKELVREIPEVVVPMEVDLKVGFNYGDMKEIPLEELRNYVN